MRAPAVVHSIVAQCSFSDLNSSQKQAPHPGPLKSQFSYTKLEYCMYIYNKRTYRRPASMVCCELRPSSFSSRLMRVVAAPRPMTTAKIGSATLEMMYVGDGILSGFVEVAKCLGKTVLVNDEA